LPFIFFKKSKTNYKICEIYLFAYTINNFLSLSFLKYPTNVLKIPSKFTAKITSENLDQDLDPKVLRMLDPHQDLYILHTAPQP